MLQIAICEDNPVHNNRLTDLLAEILKEPYTLQSFDNAEDFCRLLPSKRIDFNLVFMDIGLGESSGIEIARKMNYLHPGIPVIFISQYLECASDVYEAEHIYFIYKETMDIYLPKALEKALKFLRNPNEQFLDFSWRGEKFTVPERDILYLERQLRVTFIHTTSQTFQTSEKLSELENRLSGWFVLCHRSYVINLKMATALKKTFATIGEDNTVVPVSRNRYEEVKKQMCSLL